MRWQGAAKSPGGPVLTTLPAVICADLLAGRSLCLVGSLMPVVMQLRRAADGIRYRCAMGAAAPPLL